MARPAELSRITDPTVEPEVVETPIIKSKPTSRRLGGLVGKGAAIALAISTLAGCNESGTAPTIRPIILSEPTPVVTQIPGKESPTPSGAELLSPSSDTTPSGSPDAVTSPPPSPTETLSPREKLLTPHLMDVAAKSGMKVGVELTGGQLNNTEWSQTAAEQFNLATIDWGFNWSEVEPTRGNFDFSIADNQIAFAQSNNMEIRGQALVFPGATADWIANGKFSKSELTSILVNHIKTVVGHYKGVVKEWVIVNEPYIDPYRPNDIFYKTIGPNYIDMAFKAAREADPSAKLIYNDSGNESSDPTNNNGLTTQLTRETVQRLKSEGLVDMVGVQMHLDADNPPNKQDVINTLKSYGLPVAITEFDVNLQKISGTKTQRYNLQAQIASNMVSACRQSGVCKEFSFWGIGDNTSWLEVSLKEPNADPTLFDDSLNPKPEYFAVRKALS